MYRPEDKEDDEKVVNGPEALVVGASRFIHRGEEHCHQGKEHHVTRPAWPCEEVGFEEADEAQLRFNR